MGVIGHASHLQESCSIETIAVNVVIVRLVDLRATDLETVGLDLIDGDVTLHFLGMRLVPYMAFVEVGADRRRNAVAIFYFNTIKAIHRLDTTGQQFQFSTDSYKKIT